MRRLLNTLFVLTEDAYLALENENIVVKNGEAVLGRVPLLTVENIVYFGYKGASPFLMGECAKRGIGLCFLSTHGRFLARVCGENPGNVLLRKKQYRLSEDEGKSVVFARNFIAGKIFNARTVLERARRDHPLNIDGEKFLLISNDLKAAIKTVRKVTDVDELRGIEGNAASAYFSVLDDLILQNKEQFTFAGRSKRPPIGKVNALLSFAYTLLAHDCASALESVGLDAYVGFMHTDRPGRISLALDLMEELRAIYADRFVVTLINNRIVKSNDFDDKENGVTLLNDKGRKRFLQEWQDKKREAIVHPFLEEKIAWGLVPYVQALLLARTIRGDLDEYPAFLWK
ncbi:type I-C CRISPR-associated endonuclease Cas1c [Selenomonas ruminantium]|uniref:CRISPR-associated endonuclease Cas1 n=1 Tax=Selenomonas ruminantium TaxID=971 RepID=A0A1K1QWU9_SELRU|nr:type I-C CRISPR-associated endonuclease Cas1c [Selenomonas ruminantium]SFW64253.1 CRISP-associated protein Cas1 [Selenomonas ruminantium]